MDYSLKTTNGRENLPPKTEMKTPKSSNLLNLSTLYPLFWILTKNTSNIFPPLLLLLYTEENLSTPELTLPPPTGWLNKLKPSPLNTLLLFL